MGSLTRSQSGLFTRVFDLSIFCTTGSSTKNKVFDIQNCKMSVTVHRTNLFFANAFANTELEREIHFEIIKAVGDIILLDQ